MAEANPECTKKSLRATYLEKRRALPTEEWDALNNKLFAQIRTMPWDAYQARTIHIFLPIRKFGEPDTNRIIPIVTERSNQKLRWVLSRTDPTTGELYHFEWNENTVIRENAWGIPEPLGGYRVAEEEIDLIFVPLLAFDERGHRVGYGKGYYDRFLAKCRPDARAVGLALFPPVPAIVDVFAADIPLHACVTPDRLYTFQ